MAVGGRAGGASREITAPGNVVRMSSLHISFFSVLIPHALSSFFSPRSQSCPFLLSFWCSTGPGACIRGLALFFEIYGSPTVRPLAISPSFRTVRNLVLSAQVSFLFGVRRVGAGLLPFWCSTGSGACIRGRALFQAEHPRGIAGLWGRGMSSIICCSFFSSLVSMSF